MDMQSSHGEQRIVAMDSRKRKKGRIPPLLVRQFHTWHWVSSAICLIGMILFAITGITLNHAASIEGDPIVVTEERQLAPDLLAALEAVPDGAAVPEAVADWLADELDVSMRDRTPEWSAEELYVPLPRAGGDGWISIDRATGEVLYEDTERGWIAFLNDLHKGRDTGTAWRWFIDIFAVACVIFSLTGFLLLQIHARKRPATWPVVGAGVIIPLFLIVFLMH
jgi:hypothetical protein